MRLVMTVCSFVLLYIQLTKSVCIENVYFALVARAILVQVTYNLVSNIEYRDLSKRICNISIGVLENCCIFAPQTIYEFTPKSLIQ